MRPHRSWLVGASLSCAVAQAQVGGGPPIGLSPVPWWPQLGAAQGLAARPGPTGSTTPAPGHGDPARQRWALVGWDLPGAPDTPAWPALALQPALDADTQTGWLSRGAAGMADRKSTR